MPKATLKAAPPTPPRWADIEAGAAHIGVSTKTLRRMIAAGIVPGYRIGPRLVRVNLNELDDAAQRIPTMDGAA